MSAWTNASIRENPSNCRVFAISSIRFLHLSKAAVLIEKEKKEGSNCEKYVGNFDTQKSTSCKEQYSGFLNNYF